MYRERPLDCSQIRLWCSRLVSICREFKHGTYEQKRDCAKCASALFVLLGAAARMVNAAARVAAEQEQEQQYQQQQLQQQQQDHHQPRESYGSSVGSASDPFLSESRFSSPNALSTRSTADLTVRQCTRNQAAFNIFLYMFGATQIPYALGQMGWAWGSVFMVAMSTSSLTVTVTLTLPPPLPLTLFTYPQTLTLNLAPTLTRWR